MVSQSFDDKEKEQWSGCTPNSPTDSENWNLDNEHNEQQNDTATETWEELALPNTSISAAGRAADPAPDGGIVAWTQALCAHMVWFLIQSRGGFKLM